MKFKFYIELTHLAQILKFRLNETHGTKLDYNWIPIWNIIGFLDETHDVKLYSNWIPIWNLIGFSLYFTYYYILIWHKNLKI